MYNNLNKLPDIDINTYYRHLKDDKPDYTILTNDDFAGIYDIINTRNKHVITYSLIGLIYSFIYQKWISVISIIIILLLTIIITYIIPSNESDCEYSIMKQIKEKKSIHHYVLDYQNYINKEPKRKIFLFLMFICILIFNFIWFLHYGSNYGCCYDRDFAFDRWECAGSIYKNNIITYTEIIELGKIPCSRHDVSQTLCDSINDFKSYHPPIDNITWICPYNPINWNRDLAKMADDNLYNSAVNDNGIIIATRIIFILIYSLIDIIVYSVTYEKGNELILFFKYFIDNKTLLNIYFSISDNLITPMYTFVLYYVISSVLVFPMILYAFTDYTLIHYGWITFLSPSNYDNIEDILDFHLILGFLFLKNLILTSIKIIMRFTTRTNINNQVDEFLEKLNDTEIDIELTDYNSDSIKQMSILNNQIETI